MSDADKTKIGWAPNPPRTEPQPDTRYIGPSFVLENTSSQLPAYLQPDLRDREFADEPTTVAPPRLARGSYPQCEPYAYSPFAASPVAASPFAATQFALAPTQPVVLPPVAMAIALPPPVVRYPIHRRHSEHTVEVDAARARYARQAYTHLLAALLAFGGLVYMLMTNAVAIRHVTTPALKLVVGGRWNWAVVLGTYVVVSWLATVWARNVRSRVAAYLGLVSYAMVTAVVFVPLLAVLVRATGEPTLARDVAVVALAAFSVLVLSVALAKQRFSFMRSDLVLTVVAAASVGGMALLFDVTLGMAGAAGAVWIAALHVIHRTSHVFEYYVDRHVAGALALFASIALLPFQLLARCVRR
jgi:hypothetical protein